MDVFLFILYFLETNVFIMQSVHHGDLNITLTVVDSNRIRVKYNKPLAHFTIPKSSALGGHVCCGSSKPGTLLNFKVVKSHGKRETCRYVKDPIQRSVSEMFDMTIPKIHESTKAEPVDEEEADEETLAVTNANVTTTIKMSVVDDELPSVHNSPVNEAVMTADASIDTKESSSNQAVMAPKDSPIESGVCEPKLEPMTSEPSPSLSTLSTLSLNDEDASKLKLPKSISSRKSESLPVIVTAFALPDGGTVDVQHTTLQDIDEFGLETANCLGEIEMPNCVGENRCSIM